MQELKNIGELADEFFKETDKFVKEQKKKEKAKKLIKKV